MLPHNLLTISEVLSIVPVPRSTLYVLMQRGDFPKSVKIGKRVFWDVKEIGEWWEKRKGERDE